MANIVGRIMCTNHSGHSAAPLTLCPLWPQGSTAETLLQAQTRQIRQGRPLVRICGFPTRQGALPPPGLPLGLRLRRVL